MTEMQELSVSLEWADGYFSRRLYAGLWENASQADRVKALSWSAALISAAFDWNLSACAEGDVSDSVRAILCEEAIWLLARDPSETALFAGVKQASAGPIRLTFDTDLAAEKGRNLIAPIAAEMAAGLALPAGRLGRISSTMLP